VRRLLSALTVLAAAACVPADGSLQLGSVSFTVTASRATEAGFTTDDSLPDPFDRWTVEIDRVVLGFRTMTIGKVGDEDRCSYRGRGEASDIVFDPRIGIVQTFNGIIPANCEDVGVFLSPPGDTTEVGPGVTSRDLVELAEGDPAHAIIEATGKHGNTASIHVVLRFDTGRTSSRFGGCQALFQPKGVRVVANQRLSVGVAFAPENLFRSALGFGADFRIDPFVEADRTGNNDGIVTMNEIDAVRLPRLRAFSDGYQLPDGTQNGTFGDYLRALFRFTFLFRDTGTCVGNEPGAE
jgi:hypothetical protein